MGLQVSNVPGPFLILIYLLPGKKKKKCLLTRLQTTGVLQILSVFLTDSSHLKEESFVCRQQDFPTIFGLEEGQIEVLLVDRNPSMTL